MAPARARFREIGWQGSHRVFSRTDVIELVNVQEEKRSHAKLGHTMRVSSVCDADECADR